MRAAAEFALALTVAAGLHLAALSHLPGGAEGAGDAGTALASMAPAPAGIAALVEDWTRPPDTPPVAPGPAAPPSEQAVAALALPVGDPAEAPAAPGAMRPPAPDLADAAPVAADPPPAQVAPVVRDLARPAPPADATPRPAAVADPPALNAAAPAPRSLPSLPAVAVAVDAGVAAPTLPRAAPAGRTVEIPAASFPRADPHLSVAQPLPARSAPPPPPPPPPPPSPAAEAAALRAPPAAPIPAAPHNSALSPARDLHASDTLPRLQAEADYTSAPPRTSPVPPARPAAAEARAAPPPPASNAPARSAAQQGARASGQGAAGQRGTDGQAQAATRSDAGRQALVAAWGGQIRAQIERARPRTRGRGVVAVTLTVARDGRLVRAGVAASSGDPALDQAALAMVRGAGRFGAAPAGLDAPDYAFRLPIRFE